MTSFTPNTSIDALDETNNEEIKLALAQNPSTSQSTLKSLFDESTLIKIEAQKNYDYQEIIKKEL